MRKKYIIACISIIMAIALVFSGCNSTEKKIIAENENLNKDFIKSAVAAMGNETLALKDALDWGMSYSDIKDEVKGPYINDERQYVSKAFYSNFPKDGAWKADDGTIEPQNFEETDILSYYVINDELGLYEYGYMVPDVNLYQYDFLKEYYTKKYGEPAKEDWEWKNKSHIANENEDEERYQAFEDGYVRVMTVWDIEALDSVLVIDWLKDPAKYNNNYGQISFYQRPEDFSISNVQEGSNE